MRSPIVADLLTDPKWLLCALLGAVIFTGACERTTSVGTAGRQGDADADGEMDGDAGDQPSAVDVDAATPTDDQLCTASGGTVTTASCCMNGVASFPDTCSIGSCGCPPASSHTIATCDCPGGCFSPGVGCVQP